jgi:mono/diheme cytochrome c family protein
MSVALAFVSGGWAQDEPAKKSEEEVRAEFQKLKSPVPYSPRSVARGKSIYLRYCTECHGRDGKAQIDVVANATNLTKPDKYYHGTTEGEIFHSIRDGAGIDMPPFKTMFAKKEDDLWHMVNFVRSLWPEDIRPKVQSDKDADEAANGDEVSPGGADHE